MSRTKTLAKNTLIISISRFSILIVNFFLLPVYTSVLSTHEYGVTDLLNTFILLLAPLVSLQLEQGVFRYLVDIRDNSKKVSEYITSTLFIISIFSLVFLLTMFAVSYFVTNEYFEILIINVVAYVFSNIFLQISRGLGDNISYSIGNFLISLFTVLFNIQFVVRMGLGAHGILYSFLLSHIISVVYIFFKKKIFNYLRLKFINRDYIKELLRYSLPLVPNQLSWWLVNSSSRAIISFVLGVSANGIYAVANKFSSVFVQVYNVFNIAWVESATMEYGTKKGNSFINQTINEMMKLFSSAFIFLIGIMPLIFDFLVDSEFQEAYNHVPILLLASLFNTFVGLLSVIYIAKKETKKIALTSIYSGIISVLLHLLLIKFIGLYASSFATLISYIFLFIYRYIDINKTFQLKIEKQNVFIFLMLLIVSFVSYYLMSYNIQMLIFVFLVLILLLLNKKTIAVIINNVMKFGKEKNRES